MALNDKVVHHEVSVVRNAFVGYHRAVRLVTEPGEVVFVAFPDVPPTTWIEFTNGVSRVFLPATDFEDVHRLLRTEPTLYVTAFSLFGPAFLLTSATPPAGGTPFADPTRFDEVLHAWGTVAPGAVGGVPPAPATPGGPTS